MGRRVRCSRRYWRKKILARPEFYELRDQVNDTIRAPELISESGRIPGRMCYYSRSAPFPWEQYRIRVVVEGNVLVSSHLVTSVAPNEKVVWRRP